MYTIQQTIEQYIQMYNDYQKLTVFINTERDRFYEKIDKQFGIRGTEKLDNELKKNGLDMENFLDKFLITFTLSKNLPDEINFGIKYRQWKELEARMDIFINQIKSYEEFENIEFKHYGENLTLEEIFEHLKYEENE